MKREPPPAHPLTDAKCSKCHPAHGVFDAIKDGSGTIAGQPYDRSQIERQLVRCTRLPHSGISKSEAREILSILIGYRSKVTR